MRIKKKRYNVNYFTENQNITVKLVIALYKDILSTGIYKDFRCVYLNYFSRYIARSRRACNSKPPRSQKTFSPVDEESEKKRKIQPQSGRSIVVS